MSINVQDIVPFSEARAHLSRLVDEVLQGAEKIITKNGEAAVALIDAKRLDHYHRLERDRIHLLLLDEAEKGLDDVAAGRTTPALAGLAAWQERRAAKKSST